VRFVARRAEGYLAVLSNANSGGRPGFLTVVGVQDFILQRCSLSLTCEFRRCGRTTCLTNSISTAYLQSTRCLFPKYNDVKMYCFLLLLFIIIINVKLVSFGDIFSNF